MLPSTLQTEILDAAGTCDFISLTFIGMTIGALVTGFLGDRLAVAFTYQVNLLIFGLASLAAAFAQDMTQLNAPFREGLGLGAEIVVGYSTLTEFVPPKSRGRWLSFMAFLVVCGLPATALICVFHHSRISAGGRCSSSPASARWSSGICARILPELPRWLELKGPHRGSGSVDGRNREGSRDRGRATGACRRGGAR